MANTAIGRFWRLYLRNVAGFLLHKNDKATFGNTWRVVLAENEDVVAKIGWEPNSVEMGFNAGDNTVTIARYTGGDVLASVYGDKPERMMPYIADAVLKQNTWQIGFTMGTSLGTLRPLLVLSPILAETIAQGRLVEAGREAVPVRSRAHAGLAVRALSWRMDGPSRSATSVSR